MKFLAVLVVVFSASAFACIPCDKEATVVVLHQASPSFDKTYSSEEHIGKVEFYLDIDHKGVVKQVRLVDFYPKDLPTHVIDQVITGSKYASRSNKPDHVNCGVENFNVTMEFLLPQKFNLDIEIPSPNSG